MKAILPDPLFEETADQPDDEDSATTSAQLLREDLDAGSDGDDKEEEVKHGSSSLTSDSILRKLKYATGGVSTLFGVGEGPIKHGHVEVEPPMCVGKLIERAQNEQDVRPQPSEEKMDIELTTADVVEKHHELTIADYLSIAKSHLNFTEQDIFFAQDLYRVIDKGGEIGVQRSKLEADSMQSHHNTAFHLQSLLNFDLVSIPYHHASACIRLYISL